MGATKKKKDTQYIDIQEHSLELNVPSEVSEAVELALEHAFQNSEVLSYVKAFPRFFDGIRPRIESVKMLRKRWHSVLMLGKEYNSKTRLGLLMAHPIGVLMLQLKFTVLSRNIKYLCDMYGIQLVIAYCHFYDSPEYLKVAQDLLSYYKHSSAIPSKYAQMAEYYPTEERKVLDSNSPVKNVYASLYPLCQVIELLQEELQLDNTVVPTVVKEEPKNTDIDSEEVAEVRRKLKTTTALLKRVTEQKSSVENKLKRVSEEASAISDLTKKQSKLVSMHDKTIAELRSSEIMKASEISRLEKKITELVEEIQNLSQVNDVLSPEYQRLKEVLSVSVDDDILMRAEKVFQMQFEFDEQLALTQHAVVRTKQLQELKQRIVNAKLVSKSIIPEMLEMEIKIDDELRAYLNYVAPLQFTESSKYAEKLSSVTNWSEFRRATAILHDIAHGAILGKIELVKLLNHTKNTWSKLCIASKRDDTDETRFYHSLRHAEATLILIDGYNFIFGLTEIFSLDEAFSIVKARKLLFKYLIHFANANPSIMCQVFLDSKTASSDEVLAPNVSVEYIGGIASNKADDRLYQFAKANKKHYKSTYVVSEDKHLVAECKSISVHPIHRAIMAALITQ